MSNDKLAEEYPVPIVLILNPSMLAGKLEKARKSSRGLARLD